MAKRTSQPGRSKTTTAPPRRRTPKRAPKLQTAVYAGSFDPVTFGHLDVIDRAAKIFDRLIVAIGTNTAKPSMFAPEERVEMLRYLCRTQKNVEIAVFSGLAVKFATDNHAIALVRGLRTEVDFVYEMQMALMNRSLASQLETIFIPTSQAYGHISSTLVKEVARFGGDLSSLVPASVSRKIAEKTKSLK